MAGNRRTQLKVKVPKSKKKTKKCDICAKDFASLSSLNSHKKTKHEGRGWMCPVCQTTLASKYAYIRHTQRAHRTKQIAEVVSTAQEHEVFVKDDVAEMSEAAKSALITKLRLKVEKKDKLIASLKCKLKNYIKKSKKESDVEGEENLSDIEDEENEEEEISNDAEEEERAIKSPK